MQKFAVSIIAAIVLLPLASACNRNPLNLQEATGAVTLDSQPLDNGTIRFIPIGDKGVLGSAEIAAGKYVIPAEKGLSPGNYKVQISSADQNSVRVAQPLQMGDSPPPFKERIPEKYNIRSELTVEVKSDGGNVFDFDLSSRAR